MGQRMDILRNDRLAQWRSVLPGYVAVIIDEPKDGDPAFAELVAKSLPTFTDAAGVMKFVGENAEAFVSAGRAARLRFLAWVLARRFEDVSNFMFALSSDNNAGEDGDGDEGSGEGLERVAPYFHSDFLAFAEAIGPHVAARIVSNDTLDVVTGASLDVIRDFEMKG